MPKTLKDLGPKALSPQREQPSILVDGLTLKQQKFLFAYLGEAHGNATEAARLAGYSCDFFRVGHDNTRNPKIRAAIEKHLSEVHMTANEVLARLTDQARGIGAYIRVHPDTKETGLDVTSLLRDGKGHLIKKISNNKFGQTIEVYDAQTALDKLGKHHRLWTDNGDVDVKVLNIIFDSLPEDMREPVREKVLSALEMEG